MIERIGLRRIEAVVVDPGYRFYDPDQGGGIWLGPRYANSGEVNPDPLKGLVHAATVTQVCRFYYLLATGKIISAERSRQMLHILSFPDIHDRFVSVMERDIPLAHLYRKSGTCTVNLFSFKDLCGRMSYSSFAGNRKPSGHCA
jgi:beta-lactamase class A